MSVNTPHPAKFSQSVLDALWMELNPDWLVLDPFAGVGRLSEIAPRSVCVEMEPEWATQIVGDALHLPFRDETFDAVVTSPTFGNRMADHHDAKDGSKRHTYTHYLGRQLRDGNSGKIQWGKEYRKFHRAAWAESYRVIVPGGFMFLNSSNHIRGGVEQRVNEWHMTCLRKQGFRLMKRIKVDTPRLRHGSNSTTRVSTEMIFVFIKL